VEPDDYTPDLELLKLAWPRSSISPKDLVSLPTANSVNYKRS
jgi:hypothetical protein